MTQANEEQVKKSLDAMIDEFFAASSSESIEKAKKPMDKKEENKEGKKEDKEEDKHQEKDEKPKMKKSSEELMAAPKQAKMPEDANRHSAKTADEALAQLNEKVEEDEKAGKKRGRPSDLSQMDMRDMKTGESKGEYDASITEEHGEEENEEGKKMGAEERNHQKRDESVKKSEKIEVSKEDFELLTKAKADKEAEVLKKAQEEQRDLIKSAVAEATKDIKSENESLKKALGETQDLIKAVLRKPVQRKSIDSIQTLEKGFGVGDEAKEEHFTKSDMLNAAEKLVETKEFGIEQVSELELTGYLANPQHRKMLEDKLTRKN